LLSAYFIGLAYRHRIKVLVRIIICET
jgi:hypothetical protein